LKYKLEGLPISESLQPQPSVDTSKPARRGRLKTGHI
jgi:hypothetical protein